MKIEFRWPLSASQDLAENFFFGAWHPSRATDYQIGKTPDGVQMSISRGRNWFLCGSTSSLHEQPVSLVHDNADGSLHVAFRGYLTKPQLHSYSPTSEIVDYWRRGLSKRHNGVFATAIVDETSVSLLSDAFGFGPLYYRRWNGYLLFSTNPRFLATASDEPDMLAWRCWIQSVRRVPAGTRVRASMGGVSADTWFDFDSLPVGERAIGESAFSEVEDCFQDSIDRCLKLGNGKPFLPLSKQP